MRNKDVHISDPDLLLYADGELPFGQTSRTRLHLAACWECRVRMAEIEGTIVDFVRFHHETCRTKLQPIDGPRALLKARLRELRREAGPVSLWHWRTPRNRTRLSYAIAVLLVFLVGAGFLFQQMRKNESAKSFYSAPLPDPRLTPGATQTMTLADLCSSPHDQVVRRVPKRLREEVFREYDMAGAPAGDYEVDHLVTPGLGGSDDIRNLWPEPQYHTQWNSYVKDQLEDHLHQLVCSGQLSLVTAQKDISNNWISAYEKYFHTETPLLPYSNAETSSVSLVSTYIGPGDGPSGSAGSRILQDEPLVFALLLLVELAACFQSWRKTRVRDTARPS